MTQLQVEAARGVANFRSEQLFSKIGGYHRIVVLTHGCSSASLAKTAINLLRYRMNDIAAVLDGENAGRLAQDLFSVGGEIPVVGSIAEVDEPDALFLGTAPAGGQLPASWLPLIQEAIERGLDVVSGLHDLLADRAEFREIARANDVVLTDVRRISERRIASNAAFRPGCLRIHTVGHDCSVGKMVAAVEIATTMRAHGYDAQFVATGQTGIMISGAGIAVDGVVSDFVNGAAEQLVLENQQHDFLIVEGQGSLDHPSFSAVTLGILHGVRPDGLILCYEVGRTAFKSLDNVELRSLAELRSLYETMASIRHPCQVIGIAMNSRNVTADEAEDEKRHIERSLNLPVCDVYRHGAQPLVDAVVRLYESQLQHFRRVDRPHEREAPRRVGSSAATPSDIVPN